MRDRTCSTVVSREKCQDPVCFPSVLGNAIWLAVVRFEGRNEFFFFPYLFSLFRLAEAVGIFFYVLLFCGVKLIS